ncbi:MarR family transcriptional regulator [Gottfriedia solisilvae]|uniref:Transcriptional regulator n=1 Tax=Gottfriedia solisilvae TaxID=1516104 RepID=A0A8J3EVA5_9BACI|nr:MarR family transcriptional regulator [Gottfriedia solisilvae]GGI12875.1 transcriptional regulator [Gottfriedia solisilvae]
MVNSCSMGSLILYKLHFLNKEINSKFSGCTGVSQTRLELLHQLYQVEELSQQELQKELDVDNAAITRHLKQLEASEMIIRRKKTSDNRVTLVQLTDYGRQKISSYQEEKDLFVASMLNEFSEEEMETIIGMLNRIQFNIKEI